MELGQPDLATALIDSIVERPEEWALGKHTLIHKSGLQFWAANEWRNRRIWRIGSEAEEPYINFTDEEKLLLDRAVINFRDDTQTKQLESSHRARALKKILPKQSPNKKTLSRKNKVLWTTLLSASVTVILLFAGFLLLI